MTQPKPPSPGIEVLDERMVWDLVRGIAPGWGERSEPTRSGVDTQSGVWLEVKPNGATRTSHPIAEATQSVLDIYLPLLRLRTLTIAQLGQSLDGRIATATGASHYVTGIEDLKRLHRLRALVDVVVVGANTVAADDPQLTVRRVEGPNPIRIVLDPKRRLDRGLGVFQDGKARTITVSGQPPVAGEAAHSEATVESDEMRVSTTPEGALDLAMLVEAFHARGWFRILVEGGGATVSGFLGAGLLDRLHVAVAPLLIGSGKPSITLDPVANLDQALRPACRRFHLGDDVLFDLDLRSESQ